MPKLWTETIAAHRRGVTEAIQDATAALVAEHGLAAVTMSQIAEQTGIARATLYKYFADVDAILIAWHERLIAHHLEELAEVRDRAGDEAITRLQAVMEAYALMTRHVSHEQPGVDLAALLHGGRHVARARERLGAFIRDLVSDCAKAGDVRDDAAPDELANYCISALKGASTLSSKSAVHRLVKMTLAGLRPQRDRR